tara:strand:- start:213 stop:506 length:294 start_codon:yes stop_codon:yes gene_type:complete
MEYNKYIEKNDYEGLIKDTVNLKKFVKDNKECFEVFKNIEDNNLNYCSVFVSKFKNIEITAKKINKQLINEIRYIEKIFFENSIIIESFIDNLITGE